MAEMTKAQYAEKAAELFASFTENEQHGVRFGMFPHLKMQIAEREGYDGHTLVVALMNVAIQKGGMRA